PPSPSRWSLRSSPAPRGPTRREAGWPATSAGGRARTSNSRHDWALSLLYPQLEDHRALGVGAHEHHLDRLPLLRQAAEKELLVDRFAVLVLHQDRHEPIADVVLMPGQVRVVDGAGRDQQSIDGSLHCSLSPSFLWYSTMRLTCMMLYGLPCRSRCGDFSNSRTIRYRLTLPARSST